MTALAWLHGMRRGARWREVARRRPLKLYAGDLPADRPEYDGWVALSLVHDDARHLRHDVTTAIPLPDASVDAFQAEDVFEHIPYERLVPVIDEIHRLLRPGGLFRLSVPDYGCDVMRARCVFDDAGEIAFDPGGGGTPEHPGHVWFPRIDRVRALLEGSRFAREGTIEYLHYHKMDGTWVTKPIDYARAWVMRTPDHDPRVQDPYRPLSLVVDLVKGGA